jgi:putative ABC transport system permease protein
VEAPLPNLLRDVRFGFRQLRKHPGFTAVAVLALALGIAANTAIFSVVYATFLAPLPYRDPDRLVMVFSRLGGNRHLADAGDFAEWRRRATVFEDLNAWTLTSVNLAAGDRPEHVETVLVTPGLQAMIGHARPLAHGRDFLDEEGTVGRDQVAILSHRLWKTRFGADPGVVGRPIRIDGRPFTVVGVLAAGPTDRLKAALWLPLAFTPEQLKPEVPDLRYYVLGRLRRDVTVEEAHAEMVAVARHLTDSDPGRYREWSASVEPLRNSLLGSSTKTALWLLLGAVAFVLLIACANVANLLLARGAARRRELAVRASLGASQGAIVRQLLTESLFLALMGGGLGVALASGLLRAVMALMPAYTLPPEADVQLNLPVLLFTLAVSVFCGALFGCAPAWRASRANPTDALKDAGRSLGGGRDRLRRALVAGEFALALTLLAGAGLAIHGLFKLANVDLGFRTEGLLTFSLPVPESRLVGSERINVFYRELLDRVQAVPGVLSASVSTTMPMRGASVGFMGFEVVGRPARDDSDKPGALWSVASPAYFETFGIRLTQGRAFTARDRAGAPPVVVVNEALVRRFLPGVDPLAQRLAMESFLPGQKRGPRLEWQVVGVCADVWSANPKSAVAPEIIVPFWQSPWPQTRMAVRTAGDPMRVPQGLAAAIRSVDPELPMAELRTMRQVVAASMAGDRFNTVLFGAFATVALFLAAIGIYGVMSFVVGQRTPEIGLRMALGAGRARVFRDVLRDGMTTALLGTVLGSAGAWYVGRLMRGMVYGVGVVDPTAFLVVTLTLLAAALVACALPARRAASVDPMVALREE